MTEICFAFVEGCLSARLFRIIIRKLPSPKNVSSYKAVFHKPEKNIYSKRILPENCSFPLAQEERSRRASNLKDFQLGLQSVEFIYPLITKYTQPMADHFSFKPPWCQTGRTTVISINVIAGVCEHFKP